MIKEFEKWNFLQKFFLLIFKVFLLIFIFWKLKQYIFFNPFYAKIFGNIIKKYWIQKKMYNN